MKEFRFSYDKENDDLFVYLSNAKSEGSVEVGNFILDFDKKENLVAIQILEASKVFKKIMSKIIEISKIKQFRADIINFRNMVMIKIEVVSDSGKEPAMIALPRIKAESPALSY